MPPIPFTSLPENAILAPVQHPDFGVYIIAGGKSSRMGSDKALVRFSGTTLIERTLRLAQSFSDEVGIVGDRPELAAYGTVVPDVYSGAGPLGGIHAALGATQRPWILALAVDMPFLTPGLLDFVGTRAAGCDFAACVCEAEDRLQPLCGAYRQSFAIAAETNLKSGEYRVESALIQAGYCRITRAELEQAGFSDSSFRNINTPEDLAMAQSSVVSGRRR